MPRRGKSSNSPVWLAAAFLLLVIGGGGYYAWQQSGADPYRTIPEMDVDSYLENANSLRGNLYKFEATVQNALAWSPGDGRLMAVEIRHRGDTRVVPILIPSEHNDVNIQRGQTFHFKVEIIQDGVIRALEMRKS